MPLGSQSEGGMGLQPLIHCLDAPALFRPNRIAIAPAHDDSGAPTAASLMSCVFACTGTNACIRPDGHQEGAAMAGSIHRPRLDIRTLMAANA